MGNILPQTDKERREWIYAAIAAWLRKEVVIDIDDAGFIDDIWPIQMKMAKEFDRKARWPDKSKQPGRMSKN